MPQASVVIDLETGRPKVEAIRQPDGKLSFGYYTVRSGGMVVLAAVPPEALSGRRIDESDEATLLSQLQQEVQTASAGVAARVARGDGPEVPTPGVASTPTNLDRDRELEEAEERARKAEERVNEMEDKSADVAALEARLAEAEAAREQAEAALAAEEESQKGQAAAKKPAAKKPRTKAAA